MSSGDSLSSSSSAPLTYAVVGAGAVGGYFGGRLARSGKEVHFLFNSAYEHVKKNGLRVDSIKGDFVLPKVLAYRDPYSIPRCDVAIVALKATCNEILSGILPEILKETGTVLLLQNGMGQEGILSEISGVGRIISGLCFIGVSTIAPGHISHTDFGSVRIAEHEGARAAGITSEMKYIGQDIEVAGIPVQYDPDLVEARWRKLVWNMPFNGLSVVLGANTKEILSDAKSRARAKGIMYEVLAGAAGQGRTIPSEFVDQMLAYTDSMTPYLPSMRHDYDWGRPMELDAMYEAPISVARNCGVEMPLSQQLLAELKLKQYHG